MSTDGRCFNSRQSQAYDLSIELHCFLIDLLPQSIMLVGPKPSVNFIPISYTPTTHVHLFTHLPSKMFDHLSDFVPIELLQLAM